MNPLPRGGRRTGTAGKPYQQRTDLHVVPATAAPGQQYGAETAQLQSQQAVPIGNGDLTPAGAGASPTPPAGPQQGGPPPVTGLPAGLPPPGSMPPLTGPTDRPDEHLMTGVNAGPGPGTEALTPLFTQPLVSGVAALNSLGGHLTPQLKAIRDAAQATLTNQSVP